MGSEGYLLNQFTAPRTNKRNDAWGGDAEQAHALRGRDRAPHPRGLRPGLHHRLPPVDARPGRRRPGLGRSRAAGARRSRPPARRSSTPASAGTRRASRPSPPRCRARPSPASPRELQAARVAAADHHQPHQHARRRRSASSPRGDADMVSMARPLLADPQWVNKARERRAARRSTPASPATRPASTTCSRTRPPAAWSIRAPAPRPN